LNINFIYVATVSLDKIHCIIFSRYVMLWLISKILNQLQSLSILKQKMEIFPTALQYCFILSNIWIVATNKVNLFTVPITFIASNHETRVKFWTAMWHRFPFTKQKLWWWWLYKKIISSKLECIYDCNFAFCHCRERVQHRSLESNLRWSWA
jgi:hypothetical protein